MTRRTDRSEAIALLLALHDLARANRPSNLGVLAGRLGWGVLRVVRVLDHLEQRALADRARVRLTLAGLSAAVALAVERESLETSRAARNAQLTRCA
jgi:hypothetical protein